MDIPKKLKDEIWDYCRVNSISNIDEFTLKLLTQGFTVEKFGATPQTKEKIVEKIVEVPIQMIDTELSENLKKYMALYEQGKIDLRKAIDEMMLTKEQLGIEKEKNKNKKDLYGE